MYNYKNCDRVNRWAEGILRQYGIGVLVNEVARLTTKYPDRGVSEYPICHVNNILKYHDVEEGNILRQLKSQDMADFDQCFFKEFRVPDMPDFTLDLHEDAVGLARQIHEVVSNRVLKNCFQFTTKNIAECLAFQRYYLRDDEALLYLLGYSIRQLDQRPNSVTITIVYQLVQKIMATTALKVHWMAKEERLNWSRNQSIIEAPYLYVFMPQEQIDVVSPTDLIDTAAYYASYGKIFTKQR